MRTLLIVILIVIFNCSVMGQITFSPVECTLQKSNNELILSSSTSIVKFPLKRQLTTSLQNNFIIIDSQNLQIMFLQYDGYDKNIKGENVDNQKHILETYSKYELEYFTNQLDVEIKNPNSQWIVTKSKGWFIWYFKVGSVPTEVDAKTEIQLFATTVIGDKVLIINAPILIGGDFSNSALIVNEIMESLIITKNE